MSDEHQTEWNWGPAVRRRLARIEAALHASIGPDTRFESGAGRQGVPREAFLEGGDARPSADDVLGYGGASSGEGEAWREEAYNLHDDLSKEYAGRLKPSRRGLETLQAIVAELTQTPLDSDVAPGTESSQGAEPAGPDASPFDAPEGFLLETGPAADGESDSGGDNPSEPRAQGEGEASGNAPLDFEEMLKLIEELQNQPREDAGGEPPRDM
ncbi:MAG: hypothetical protein ACLFU6_01110 [Candidatus Hydrogenedentota bacterium]